MPNEENLFKPLYSVPKNEVLKLMLSRLGNEQVLNALKQVRGAEVSLGDLRRASHTELIRIAEISTCFGEEDIIRLHEEFRYRGTKTFYIYSYPLVDREALDQILQTEILDGLNSIIQGVYGRYNEDDPSPKFTSLQLRGTDRFNVEDENLWELLYSYIATVKTTDPKTEEAQFNPDLRYGFIWINRTIPWLMISAKDEAIADVFAQSLELYLNTRVTRLPIPKAVEIAVESYENLRRASHLDERGLRTRVAHQHLSDFPEEIEEIQQRDNHQARISSGYNASVEEFEFALGYSREKGAIYFTKLLPTTRLRYFGAQKLSTIYRCIHELQEQSPDDFIPLVVNRVLAGSKGTTKELIQEVISKLVFARRAHLDEVEINKDPIELSHLIKYFTLYASVWCEDCNDLQNIQCSTCGAVRFIPEAEHLACVQCNAPIEAGEVQCLMGHSGYLASAQDAITLYPTQSMLSVVEETIFQTTQMHFNRHEEGFLLRGSTLHIFGSHGEKIVYQMEDISEFQGPSAVQLSIYQKNDLVTVLKGYREKCPEMANITCGRCVQNRVSPYCLMRLYGLYDHGYTPRPHRGGEFGDVSLNITIQGHHDQKLAILLKRGNPKGYPITLRHKIGQDLYTQIVPFWTNPDVAMIGIAVPQRLEDGFIARLQRLARHHNKLLILFNSDELAQIIQFVLNRDGINPDEL